MQWKPFEGVKTEWRQLMYTLGGNRGTTQAVMVQAGGNSGSLHLCSKRGAPVDTYILVLCLLKWCDPVALLSCLPGVGANDRLANCFFSVEYKCNMSFGQLLLTTAFRRSCARTLGLFIYLWGFLQTGSAHLGCLRSGGPAFLFTDTQQPSYKAGIWVELVFRQQFCCLA